LHFVLLLFYNKKKIKNIIKINNKNIYIIESLYIFFVNRNKNKI